MDLGKAPKMQTLQFLKLDGSLIFDSEYLDVYWKGTHSHAFHLNKHGPFYPVFYDDYQMIRESRQMSAFWEGAE